MVSWERRRQKERCTVSLGPFRGPWRTEAEEEAWEVSLTFRCEIPLLEAAKPRVSTGKLTGTKCGQRPMPVFPGWPKSLAMGLLLRRTGPSLPPRPVATPRSTSSILGSQRPPPPLGTTRPGLASPAPPRALRCASATPSRSPACPGGSPGPATRRALPTRLLRASHP